MAPQDVGLSVPVKVADPHNAPVEIGHGIDVTVAQNSAAGHEPARGLAGRTVAPQDVGLAVPVEIVFNGNGTARGRFH